MFRYLSLLSLLSLPLQALPLRFELQNDHYAAPAIRPTPPCPVFAGPLRMTLDGAPWTAPPPAALAAAFPTLLSAGQPARAVPQFARVRYTRLYPGIDLVFHGDKSGLEYDFVL